jgi:hypothetical protein
MVFSSALFFSSARRSYSSLSWSEPEMDSIRAVSSFGDFDAMLSTSP